MTKRATPKAILLILPLYLSFSIIAGVFVAEGALHPGRRVLTTSDKNQEILQAKDDDAILSDVSITADDGAVLRAWLLRPEEGNGDFVILLHGLSDNRFGMTGYADLALIHGYGVLMPDARAHGASGGNLATYGLLEAQDIHSWFQYLLTTQHPHCIYAFGESMGAAQVLQSLTTEPDFCAAAGECPFSTFREIAYDRMGQAFHTGPWLGRTILRPLVESAFLYAKWKYGLDLRLVSPEGAVAATKVPVFLIHGQNDSNIPIRHSRRIAARNPNVLLWEVPNADHADAIAAAPQEFERRLISWLENHSQPPTSSHLLRHADARFVPTT